MVIILNLAALRREAIIVNFSIEWYVEDQVLFVKHWGATQPEAVRLQMETMNQKLDESAGQLIHVIIDLSAVTKALGVKDFPKAFAHFKLIQNIVGR